MENDSITCDHPYILKEPPHLWYQRKDGFLKLVVTCVEPSNMYHVDLIYVSKTSDGNVNNVDDIRILNNRTLFHDVKNDVRNGNILTINCRVSICSRKGDQPFCIRVVFDSGHVLVSRPFRVKNRHRYRNTFRSDAKYVLGLIQWCEHSGKCHICGCSQEDGHSSKCLLGSLIHQ